jgi:YHS domain-containing protein
MRHSSKSFILSLLVAFTAVLLMGAVLQAEELVECPVSGKEIEKSEAKGSFEYKGTTYYFCCDNCKQAFVKDPEEYINAEPGAHHQHGEHHEQADAQQHGEGQGDEHAVKCPVMGHEIADLEKAESYEYEGKTYYFCCPGCKEKFIQHPEIYIESNGDKIICPVMGNEVKDPEKAAKSVYEGKTYYFCCPGCKEPFDKDPEKYINKK